MINLQESNAIRYIRSFAFICIIVCHLQQAYDNKWAWIFNVGVQVFLTISGYLYGNKNIVDWSKWYKDKIKKLYVPYAIYILLTFLVYRFTDDCDFTFKNLLIYLLDMQMILGSVNGLEHLWFMTAIAMCYILTPLLQCCRNKAALNLFFLSVLAIFNIFLFKIYLGLFLVLFIYSFSYLFANLKECITKVYIVAILFLFVLVLCTLNWDILIDYANYHNKLFHVLLAFICVFPPLFLTKYLKLTCYYWVRKIDEYSYYGYITHHLFIMGPFSISFMTEFVGINIVFIILLIITASLVLKFLSDKLNYLLKL